MICAGRSGHRFVIRDRDTIYSEGVDRTFGPFFGSGSAITIVVGHTRVWGIPEGPPLNEHNAASWRHRLPQGYRVAATPILSGLHHEYRLEQKAA